MGLFTRKKKKEKVIMQIAAEDAPVRTVEVSPEEKALMEDGKRYRELLRDHGNFLRRNRIIK